MEKMRKKLAESLSAEQKTAFLTTVILALVTHFYAFTNLIVNHDCLNAFVQREATESYLGSGRWAIIPLLALSEMPCIPAVIGTLSVLALAVSCMLLVTLFQIRTFTGIVLTCGVVVTFPVAANIFCYMYTADAYFIAMSIGILAVCLLERSKLDGFRAVGAVVLLVLVCGIYQAYWCFAAALLFVLYFLRFVEQEDKLSALVRRGLVRIGLLAASLVFYLGATKLLQWINKVDFSSYQGFNNMGDFGGLNGLYLIVREAWLQFVRFYVKEGSMVRSGVMIACNLLLFAFMLTLLGRKFYRKKRKLYESLIFFAVLAVSPLALNILSVLSKNILHAVMLYAFTIPYLLTLCLVERSLREDKGRWMRVLCTVGFLAVAFISYKNYLVTNKIYVRLQLDYEATYAYLNRLVMRLEESPDYRHGITISFVNESDIQDIPTNDHVDILDSNYPEYMGEFDDLNGMVGVDQRTMVSNEKDIADFCRTFFGFDIQRGTVEDRVAVSQSPEFADMPVYPDEGAIRRIGDQLAVKLPD